MARKPKAPEPERFTCSDVIQHDGTAASVIAAITAIYATIPPYVRFGKVTLTSELIAPQPARQDAAA